MLRRRRWPPSPARGGAGPARPSERRGSRTSPDPDVDGGQDGITGQPERRDETTHASTPQVGRPVTTPAAMRRRQAAGAKSCSTTIRRGGCASRYSWSNWPKRGASAGGGGSSDQVPVEEEL